MKKVTVSAMAIETSPEKRWFSRFGELALIIAVLATALGCGDSSEPVAHLAGKVTLAGKPIPSDAEASITFVSEALEGEVAKVAVPINVSDGQYDSPNTPLGGIRAYFSISRKGPKTLSERTGQEYQEEINLVPGRYSTGIPLQITGDNTSQNFDL